MWRWCGSEDACISKAATVYVTKISAFFACSVELLFQQNFLILSRAYICVNVFIFVKCVLK